MSLEIYGIIFLISMLSIIILIGLGLFVHIGFSIIASIPGIIAIFSIFKMVILK